MNLNPNRQPKLLKARTVCGFAASGFPLAVEGRASDLEIAACFTGAIL
jgi:hypothetical protein